MLKRIGLIMTLICCLLLPASAIHIDEDQVNIEDLLLTNERNVELRQRQALAHQMAECARALGYLENHVVIETAQQEWYMAAHQIEINNSQAEYWRAKFEQYPAATYWWLYLTRTLNYSDAVAAGIVGNIMVEVGGKTLDIKPTRYSAGGYYYGSCQWNCRTYPAVQGANLKQQCDFLAQTIQSELDQYGWLYGRGYTYAQFTTLTSAKEAALMFAKAYERCSSRSYLARQKGALTAYEYFTTN